MAKKEVLPDRINREYLTFTFVCEGYGRRIVFTYEQDSLSDVVDCFKDFLLGVGYGEDTIDKVLGLNEGE